MGGAWEVCGRSRGTREAGQGAPPGEVERGAGYGGMVGVLGVVGRGCVVDGPALAVSPFCPWGHELQEDDSAGRGGRARGRDRGSWGGGGGRRWLGERSAAVARVGRGRGEQRRSGGRREGKERDSNRQPPAPVGHALLRPAAASASPLLRCKGEERGNMIPSIHISALGKASGAAATWPGSRYAAY